MGRILIKNGRIWDGERFFVGDVLTENDRILRISESVDEEADYVYDASGKIVSAGLVDAHVHMKGISSDAYGIDATMTSIPFGVTAAADAEGTTGDEARLNDFLVKGCVFVGVQFKENRACFDHTREMLKKYGTRAAGVKVYFDVKVSEVRSIDPLREVVNFAEENGLKVMVHSSNPPVSMAELLSALRSGDILTHAYHGGTNNISDDGFACIRQAKARGVIIDTGYAGHVHANFRVLREAIAHGAAPDTISSDITRCSAFKRGGRYGLTMCLSIARHLGMSEEDVLRAVTSAPASALGRADEWGMLAVGRCADIAVLEESDEGFDLTDAEGNRVFSPTGYRCVMTVANGEVVYRR